MKINKVWFSDLRTILVVLDKDVEKIPNFNLDLSKNISFSVERLNPYEFAHYTSYFRRGNKLHFYLDDDEELNICKNGHMDYYVCGNFNNWQAGLKWKMNELANHSSARELIVDFDDKVFDIDDIYFKFYSGDGHWLEPRACATNRVVKDNGIVNLKLDVNKTGNNVFKIKLSSDINLNEKVYITLNDKRKKIKNDIIFRKLYEDTRLGAYKEDGVSCFEIFAPRAKNVSLVYKKADENLEHKIQASRKGTLLWHAKAHKDLQGYEYMWEIDGNLLQDPYCPRLTSSSGFGIVSYFEDLPKAKNDFKTPSLNDLVIMELHIRDVLANATNVENKLGFEGITKYLADEDCYIRKSGVNCVELQPIQEFTAENKEDYEWGYMPVNWFAPASSYGTSKGSANKDFAEMIDAFHKAGIAVILDVVYNHIGEPNFLINVDRQYYFEHNEFGDLMNYSGCGNDFSSETPMGLRLIIDSLKHLVSQYKIDGFRFDLAELLGLKTLSEIETQLKKEKSDIIIIAEPWSFRGHIAHALKDSQYASWNDGFREFILKCVKGECNFEALKYYINGSLKGMATKSWQSVNYIESHDDMCLYDRLSSRYADPSLDDIKQYKLAYAYVILSIGIPMLAEGFDLLRTKNGLNNTYKNGIANALDYNRGRCFTGLQYWLRGLVEFRLSNYANAIRYANINSDKYLKFYEGKHSNTIGVLFNADSSQAYAKKIFVVYNNAKEFAKLDVDFDLKENFVQIADIDCMDISGIDSVEILEKYSLNIAPLSVNIWIEC